MTETFSEFPTEVDAFTTTSLSGERGATEHPVDPASKESPRAKKSRRKAEEIDDHSKYEDHADVVVDLRFSDPLILEIRELWRMRRRWMKARNALILQAKAFGRALADGDKDAGTAIYDKVLAGKSDNNFAIIAMGPFIDGIHRFDTEMTGIEKTLAKLAKKLPVAPWVEQVRGFGFPSLAAIVGECGDLSRYPSVAGVWKRCGLAVIDGDGRQRRVADVDRAAVHGYSPERRSAIWNVAEPIARLQRTWVDKTTGEIKKPADHYGEILEAEKAKALAADLKPAHAEARAKRHMTKKLLRDLTVEWRRVAGRGETRHEQKANEAESLPLQIAAE